MKPVTKADLISFEAEIATLWEAGQIKAPVHLSSGNEDQLIEIFKNIKKDDWVLSTHRSHYHALLKGIPREWLKREIIKGRSITLNNSDYHFFSSAIVGGILPIGVGLAMAGHTVWVFVGDMSSTLGIFSECQKYARGHNLPITFVIEDNGFSVNSPSSIVWGEQNPPSKIIQYGYERVYPHVGSGKWVNLF